jgi:NADPH:quinone reductase-like Zn-dependent oxidoreductase
MTMEGTLPNGGLQLRSTVTRDGTVELELADVAVAPPADDQVVVRIEASPINPSDIIPMLAGADPEQARFGGAADRPKVTLPLSPEAARGAAARAGHPLPIGLEGAGMVVAAGKDAQALLGKRVAFLSLSLGAFGHYTTVSVNDCVLLPDGVSAREAADVFVNPLTALAMVETLRQTGQTALIHTAAASNLGRMLVRICKEDGVPLVNIVRRQEQVELLRGLGAEHVCDSSLPSFREDLREALRATGATVAFDAIGGGTMASQLLAAMEASAAEREGGYSPYGSSAQKWVNVYGYLDPSPIVIPHVSYGLTWAVEGWAMPPILAKAGAERAGELRQRVLDNLTTTFASTYGHEISLAQALQRDAMLGYCRLATGRKYLINPWL